MKTVWKGLMVAAALAATVSVSDAQIVVRARLGRPVNRVVVHRPPPPSPRHVWVEEDWVPRGRTYAWHGGYWAAPPRPRAIWVPGHWDRRHHGYVWIGGYWR
jgi:hypothetical protein